MGKAITIVHPNDPTTTFLDKIKKPLISGFPTLIHSINIEPNDHAHENCLKYIKALDSNRMVIFFGHGTNEKLYGAKGSNNTYVNAILAAENPNLLYDRGNFIDSSTISVFNQKKVFCLSCNSNGKIGKSAINQGAKVFIGFGDLPTSIVELKTLGEESKSGTSLKTVVASVKSEINYILKRSFEIAIEKSYNFSQLTDLISFITSQRISHYLVDRKQLRERRIIVNHLFGFKSEMTIFGDGNLKLIDE